MDRDSAPDDTWAIESLEADVAVLESPEATPFTVPRGWLPPRVAEGDRLRVIARSGVVRFAVDAVATRRARERVARLRAELAASHRDDGRDVKL